MLKIFNLFIYLILFSSTSFSNSNNISLKRNGSELDIYYNIPEAIEIEIDSHYTPLVVENKTFLISKEGKFKVTLKIEPVISKDYYDPLRLYSNGEFLLYKDFLIPSKIKYKEGEALDKKKDILPNFLVLEDKSYINGDRFIFFGKKDKIKIIGLESNPSLKEKILRFYDLILSYYSEKFGMLSREKPILIIDFIENGGKFHYKGDALGNLLSYNILNVGDLKENEYYRIYNFISHEIFHLWNAYEHEHIGESWLHEGSAEYFSMLSLYELGYIDEHKFDIRGLNKAYIDACYRYYKENPEKIMNSNNAEFSIYICGKSLHIILEELEGKEMVIDVWKSLFKNKIYHSNEFFEAIKKHPRVNKETVDRISDFLYKKGGVVRCVEMLHNKPSFIKSE